MRTKRVLGWWVLAMLSGCAWVLEYPVTSASAGVWGATGKGPADHALSNVAGQDCELLRVADLEPVCLRDKALPRVEDRHFAPLPPRR